MDMDRIWTFLIRPKLRLMGIVTGGLDSAIITMTAANSRATSPTPSSSSSARRLSLSQRIANLGAKLARTETETTTVAATTQLKERSQSRGREAFSTGRGGLGNLRPSSASTSRTRPDELGHLRPPSRVRPDGLADSRGREAALNSTRNYSTGRGGAGNIRSPSRDTAQPVHEIIIAAAASTEPHSSGRGGIGNFSSRSRSRGPASIVPSPTRRTAPIDILDETDEAADVSTGPLYNHSH